MDTFSWDDLEHSLARHLPTMPDDAIFTVYVDESSRPGFDADFDDHPRYVQLLAYGDGMVRCEVVSNTYLPDDMRHTIDDLIRPRADGWNLPADGKTSGRRTSTSTSMRPTRLPSPRLLR
ncbi:hypothetical protein [Aeromicrobium sp. NPDC092404]|uniref:TY-Chap domain-containing protein n=1 Tax=Aeromicrobium sp. NPDC092404 TaxID=3154976 RepID=UPI0034224D50